jgi:hypothetical protein
MDVDSDYLSGFAHRPPNDTTAVAGTADPSGPKVANGIGFPPRPGTRCFRRRPQRPRRVDRLGYGKLRRRIHPRIRPLFVPTPERRTRPTRDRPRSCSRRRGPPRGLLAETDMSRGLTREIPAPRAMMVKPKTAEQRSS